MKNFVGEISLYGHLLYHFIKRMVVQLKKSECLGEPYLANETRLTKTLESLKKWAQQKTPGLRLLQQTGRRMQGTESKMFVAAGFRCA